MPESENQNTAWYACEGRYIGSGSVLATGLNKLIEGTFTVDWDDLGRCDIVANPTNVDPHDLMRLMNEFDRFCDLRIEAASGTFVCPKVYLGGISFGTSSPTEISFSTLRGIYIAREATEAAYWNVPLVNLLTQFRASQPYLEHPLRIKPRPAIPGESESLRSLRECEANRLCLFNFAGEVAFIERMPSYEDAKDRLESKASQYESTCMMVGSVPESPAYDLDGILNWIPVDAITALSLASGRSVGFGFVDLRDASASLHGRIHASFSCEAYEDNPLVISDLLHRGTLKSGLSCLLESFIGITDDTRQKVTALAQIIGTAKSQLSTPDHAFTTIVRALDGISNSLSLNRRRLLLEVPAEDQAAVRAIIVRARDELNQIAKGMILRGAPSPDCASVRQIASRLEQADALEDSFGLTLPRLLRYYSLEDEQAIADCYLVKPRHDSLTWPEVLNKYRSQVIHKGFINYRMGISIRDVVAITRHLIDVATRICLIEVGYNGTYNPLNQTALQDCSIYYFKSAQDADSFGLSGLPPQAVQVSER